MSKLILPAADSVSIPMAAYETSIFTIGTMAVIYVAVFIPILWRQFKESR